MSLTSYRAAPPRVDLFVLGRPGSRFDPTAPGDRPTPGGSFRPAFPVSGCRPRAGRKPPAQKPKKAGRRPFVCAAIVQKIDLSLRFSRAPFRLPFAHRAFGRPGDVLLSHALRRSTIGAEGLHGRVRNGIGCYPLAITTRSTQRATAKWMTKDPDFNSAWMRASRLPLRTTPQSSQSSD